MASPPQTLTPTPYGVSVFTDISRQKSFVTLFFKRKETSLEKAAAFPRLVLDALWAAGLDAAKPLDVSLNPSSSRPNRSTCHVKVEVRSLLDASASLADWAEELKASAAQAPDAEQEAG